jgi:hypothetical protein
MGRQVVFIQSEEDEADFIAWATMTHQLSCLPKIMKETPSQVLSLGQCEARSQKIFPSEYTEQALALVTKVAVAWRTEGAEGEPRGYHLNPVQGRGLSIDWLRTPRIGSGEYVPRGRYYFQFDRGHVERSKRVEKLANSFFRYVRTKYPMRVCQDYSYNRYVGPRLAQAVANGTSKIMWSNGTEVEIEPNPSYKPPKRS